jgi:hypothetical protein
VFAQVSEVLCATGGMLKIASTKEEESPEMPGFLFLCGVF